MMTGITSLEGLKKRLQEELEVSGAIELELVDQVRMRVQLIGHLLPCMTDIYLHIVARMADYMATHPYGAASFWRVPRLNQWLAVGCV